MKKIILLSIIFLSFSIHSKSLSFGQIELGMSEKKLSRLLEDSNYKHIEELPNNWKQFVYVPKSIVYKCKVENGFITEFIVMMGGKGNSKQRYESEFKATRELYGDPIRMGFRISLYKINNQFHQLAVMDNPEDKGYIIEMLTFTSTIDSSQIIKGENDMCLDNMSSLYNQCEK
jgi:hypothetical protein